MKQFLETICILDGAPQHLEWHQQRVDATMQCFYPFHKHSWLLDSCIHIPSEFSSGHIRCRIIYDAHLLSIHFYPYTPGRIQSLRLIEAPGGFDYSYKYADRSIIENLYAQRGDADDILITREGWITDTSMGNIAFEKNGRWYTPSRPLLAGTTWKRLVKACQVIPKPIQQSDCLSFDNFKIFNAMNTFESVPSTPVNRILYG